jgi:hypothetical protein
MCETVCRVVVISKCIFANFGELSSQRFSVLVIIHKIPLPASFSNAKKTGIDSDGDQFQARLETWAIFHEDILNDQILENAKTRAIIIAILKM